MATHVRTLRVPEDEHRLVAAVAATEGVSTNEFTRQALLEAVAQRRSDPQFMARLRERMDRDRDVLDALAK